LVLWFRVQVPGFRVHGLEVGVEDSGFQSLQQLFIHHNSQSSTRGSEEPSAHASNRVLRHQPERVREEESESEKQ
jgi:hypothetical protein